MPEDTPVHVTAPGPPVTAPTTPAPTRPASPAMSSDDKPKINVDELFAQTVANVRAGSTVYGKSLSSVDCLKYVPSLRGKVVVRPTLAPLR